MININTWLKQATVSLKKVDNPKKEAEILLQFVINKSLSWILAFEETILTNKQIFDLDILIKRRVYGEPIAYIIGKCEFWSLEFYISNISMIPRIDSEFLVEKTLEYIPLSHSSILDLGCGCGALTLALANARPDCLFIGVDYLEDLIYLSQYNAKKLKIKNVTFIKSNWFSELKNKKFDIIISNPPYIDISDPHLLIGDLRFEPSTALIAKENGLYNIKLISQQSIYFLKSRGWLLFEHGWNQSSQVTKILKKNSFTKIFTYKDYSNCDRVTIAMNK